MLERQTRSTVASLSIQYVSHYTLKAVSTWSDASRHPFSRPSSHSAMASRLCSTIRSHFAGVFALRNACFTGWKQSLQANERRRKHTSSSPCKSRRVYISPIPPQLIPPQETHSTHASRKRLQRNVLEAGIRPHVWPPQHRTGSFLLRPRRQGHLSQPSSLEEPSSEVG